MRVLRFAIVLVVLTSMTMVLGNWDALSVEHESAANQGAQKTTVRGPVSATIRLEPSTIRIGDAVELELEVVAHPEIELLMPVFGESLERFQILDFAPRERIDEHGRTVATQRYRLQVMTSGKHTIPPIMVEFVDHRAGERPAPEDEDAYELLTETIQFEVLSVTPADNANALRPPLGALAVSTAASSATYFWPLLSFLLVVVLVLAWVVYTKWHQRARRRTAYDVAFARLAALRAQQRPDANAMDGFFVELSDLVRRYLEDRFAVQAPELTTEEFLDVAAVSPDFDDDQRGFLLGFLRSADQVKFARHVPAPDYVETILSAVSDFLEQTRLSTESVSALARMTSVA